jgi:hypothetical protein
VLLVEKDGEAQDPFGVLNGSTMNGLTIDASMMSCIPATDAESEAVLTFVVTWLEVEVVVTT